MLSPFGEWVRAFREKKRITLREMSRTLGKSPSFLSALELGRKSVPISFLEEFSSVYDLSVDQFSELKRAVSASRTQARVSFEAGAGNKEKEVAMLFARNFSELSEDQTERIREILEEVDVRNKR